MNKSIKKMVLTGAAVTMMSFAVPAMADKAKAPQDNPPVKDPGISTCDITPTGCVKDPATNDDPSTVENPVTGNTPMDEEASAPGAMKAEEQEEEVPEGITTTAPEDDDATSALELANGSESPLVTGCAFGAYEEDFYTCMPKGEDWEVISVIDGTEPWPDSVGGYASMLGGIGEDAFTLYGLMGGAGGSLTEAFLDWYGEDAGPIGWGIQGVGYTAGFVGEVSGLLLEGAGQVGGIVNDAVGDVVDTIADAAGDAWDEISSWW